MGQITDFVDDVRAEVPGAMDGVITTEVLKVLRKFCRRTTRYRATLPDITLVLNQVAYTVGGGASNLVLPTDSEIVIYTNCSQNGVPVEFKRLQDLQKLYYNWQAETGSQVLALYPTDNQTVNAFPIPTDVTYPLVLEVALMPTITAVTYPDFILNDWQETITAGTVARLKRQADKEWTDVKTAADKEAEFMAGVDDASIQLDRGFANRVRTAQVPRFGA